MVKQALLQSPPRLVDDQLLEGLQTKLKNLNMIVINHLMIISQLKLFDKYVLIAYLK